MADYDVGAVGGILVGQTQHGSEAVQDSPQDAGVMDSSLLARTLGTPTPLEPVYAVGPMNSFSYVNPYLIGSSGDELVRVYPRFARMRD